MKSKELQECSTDLVRRIGGVGSDVVSQIIPQVNLGVELGDATLIRSAFDTLADWCKQMEERAEDTKKM